jgi:hypothetical protein
MRLHRAWVSLHAMDFAGVLAICNSTLPLIRDSAPHPAPDYPTPYPAVVLMGLLLTGSAETALAGVSHGVKGKGRYPLQDEWDSAGIPYIPRGQMMIGSA